MATGRFDLSNLQFRGRVGDLVFLPQPDGRFVVRRMPSRPPRRTALQRTSSERMEAAAAAWRSLTLEEGEAWARWAATEGRRGYNAFVGLAAKRLQAFPDEPVPRLPPETGFLGDGVIVVAQASLPANRGDWGEEGREMGFAGTEARATPGVSFLSSAPNAPGVLTELLVQRLRSLHRKPLAKEYKSQAFVAFADGALSAEVLCEGGAYACAIRFVRAATGQETAVVPLGKVVV